MDSKINLIQDLGDKFQRVTSMSEVLYAAMLSDAYPMEVDELKGTVWALRNLLLDAQQSFKEIAKVTEGSNAAFDISVRTAC